MRIGQLAKLTGLSRDTIRFYERNGLIASAPSGDPTNSYRRYGHDCAERLGMIVAAREAGLSVADLKMLFQHMEAGGHGAFDADAFFAGKIAEVERTIAQGQQFLTLLRQMREGLALAANDKPSPSPAGTARPAEAAISNGHDKRDWS